MGERGRARSILLFATKMTTLPVDHKMWRQTVTKKRNKVTFQRHQNTNTHRKHYFQPYLLDCRTWLLQTAKPETLITPPHTVTLRSLAKGGVKAHMVEVLLHPGTMRISFQQKKRLSPVQLSTSNHCVLALGPTVHTRVIGGDSNNHNIDLIFQARLCDQLKLEVSWNFQCVSEKTIFFY